MLLLKDWKPQSKGGERGFNGTTPSKFDFGIQLQQLAQDQHYCGI
jgi:hypothetical protein